MKSYGVAVALAFFLGGIGGHKYYLNKPGVGILYTLFFWTFIPALIAFIEMVIMLAQGHDKFNEKYNKHVNHKNV